VGWCAHKTIQECRGQGENEVESGRRQGRKSWQRCWGCKYELTDGSDTLKNDLYGDKNGSKLGNGYSSQWCRFQCAKTHGKANDRS
jgi:hypothetical protein